MRDWAWPFALFAVLSVSACGQSKRAAQSGLEQGGAAGSAGDGAGGDGPSRAGEGGGSGVGGSGAGGSGGAAAGASGTASPGGSSAGEPSGSAGEAGSQGGSPPTAGVLGSCFRPELDDSDPDSAGPGGNDLDCNEACAREQAVCAAYECDGATAVVYGPDLAIPCEEAPIASDLCTSDDFNRDGCRSSLVPGQGIGIEWPCGVPVPIGSTANFGRARCCCVSE